MRVFTYKRTHTGDPDSRGRFGIHNCMGKVRSFAYDAVIGVGGISAEPKRHGINGKINWVGIGPIRGEDDVVIFKHFLLLEELGPLLEELAPQLAARVYGDNVRVLTRGYTEHEQVEAEHILEWSRTPEAKQLLRPGRRYERSGCRSKSKPVCKPNCRERCR